MLVSSGKDNAVFALSSGIFVGGPRRQQRGMGSGVDACTGSKAHLRKLDCSYRPHKEAEIEWCVSDRDCFLPELRLSFIAPELREGHDEVERALENTLPLLVSLKDLRGELHTHSISSDGADSIQQMAIAAGSKGYEYIGITDHSQSLKIAGRVSVEDLWKQSDLSTS